MNWSEAGKAGIYPEFHGLVIVTGAKPYWVIGLYSGRIHDLLILILLLARNIPKLFTSIVSNSFAAIIS